jgi:hypothetical protein
VAWLGTHQVSELALPYSKLSFSKVLAKALFEGGAVYFHHQWLEAAHETHKDTDKLSLSRYEF